MPPGRPTGGICDSTFRTLQTAHAFFGRLRWTVQTCIACIPVGTSRPTRNAAAGGRPTESTSSSCRADKFGPCRKRVVCFTPDPSPCLLYTSDAADEEDSVDLGGRR